MGRNEMITALIIIGSIVAYLCIGAVALRITHRWIGFDDEEMIFIPLIVIGWPVGVAFGAICAFFYGCWRFAAMPTRRERREARHAKAKARIAELERELWIGDR